MNPQVLGISGSPVPNSNTDRVVRQVLESTGLRTEFIKLASRRVGPCRACLACAADNVCKNKDDFPELAEKIKTADALVVGGYPPYGSLDAFTKAFLERLFSLRHNKALNRGKLAVTVITGNGRGSTGVRDAGRQLQNALLHEGMEVLGQIEVLGNVKCVSCGFIETCPMSALPRLFGGDIKAVPAAYCRAEDQTQAWQQAEQLGREIGRRLHNDER